MKLNFSVKKSNKSFFLKILLAFILFFQNSFLFSNESDSNSSQSLSSSSLSGVLIPIDSDFLIKPSPFISEISHSPSSFINHPSFSLTFGSSSLNSNSFTVPPQQDVGGWVSGLSRSYGPYPKDLGWIEELYRIGGESNPVPPCKKILKGLD